MESMSPKPTAKRPAVEDIAAGYAKGRRLHSTGPPGRKVFDPDGDLLLLLHTRESEEG